MTFDVLNVILRIRFLLTRPSRDVTPIQGVGYSDTTISTHTPLAGRDMEDNKVVQGQQDFYSHAPRGT